MEVDQADEPGGDDGALIEEIENEAMLLGEADLAMKWVKTLTKAFVNIATTHDQNGNADFVLSDRVSYARDMAMIALFERMSRIFRSDEKVEE